MTTPLWTVLDEALEAAILANMAGVTPLGIETLLVGIAWDGNPTDIDTGDDVDLPLAMILSNQAEQADEDEYECDDSPALERRYNYLVSALVADPDHRQARQAAQILYARAIASIKALYPLAQWQSGIEYAHSIEWGRAFIEERGRLTLSVTDEAVWLQGVHVAFDIVSKEG